MDIISSLTSSSPSPFAGTAGAFVEASNMRTQQIRAVTSMLQFNDMSTASTSLSDLTKQQESQQDIVWKVLIFDQFGQEIISPLLKVNELREQGVTVHMLGFHLYPFVDLLIYLGYSIPIESLFPTPQPSTLLSLPQKISHD